MPFQPQNLREKVVAKLRIEGDGEVLDLRWKAAIIAVT